MQMPILDLIFLLLVGLAMLLSGISVGRIWGIRSGYKKGLADSKRNPITGDSWVENSVNMKRICAEHIVCYPNDIPRYAIDVQNTEAANSLGRKLAHLMLRSEPFGPKILERTPVPHGEHLRIGISFYLAADPGYFEYPPLESYRRADFYR